MNHEKDALEQEILKKIEEMESPEYQFPKRFTKGDYTAAITATLICLAILIGGAWL